MTTSSLVYENFTLNTSSTGLRQSGKFFNPSTGSDDGEWWIEGPLNVVSITPSTVIFNGSALNGAMLDPNATVTEQGLTSSGDATANYNPSYNWGLTVSAAFPLGVTVNPAASSYSSIVVSYTSGGTATDPVVSSCVFTVVGSSNIPRAGDYRPWDAGPVKQVGYFNTSNETTDSLTSWNLGWAGGDVTTVTDRVLRYGGINIQSINGNSVIPTANRQRYYRDFNLEMSYAMVLLMSNQRTNGVMRGIIQRGIDTYGAWYNGCRWQAASLAGHASGRLPIIQVAGKLLNNSSMINAYTSGTWPVELVEVGQTFYVEETSPGVYNYGHPDSGDFYWDGGAGAYQSSDVGVADWGNYHEYDVHQDPAQWTDTKSWVGSGYRQCCSMVGWVGMLLALKQLNLKSLWNHDELWDYAERYVTIERGGAPGNNQLPDSRVMDAYDSHWNDTPGGGGSNQTQSRYIIFIR